MNFDQLFKHIFPEKISASAFTLVGIDSFAITAGKKDKYNSILGSGGGMGVLFKKTRYGVCSVLTVIHLNSLK